MPKINKILFADTKSEFEYTYQNWYFPLKRHCKKIIDFDPQWNHLVYGKEVMNKKFLEFIKKEKPDHIFLWVGGSLFYFDTLLKIRELSPKTQTFMVLQDDDSAFENFSRYFILAGDYGLIFHKRYIPKYKKQGTGNVFYSAGIDTKFFRNLNMKKKYDVVFIGCPKSEPSRRYEFIKFLKDKGIKIKLFGPGWQDYPEFKDIYGGILDSKKMIKVINQTKIFLNLTRNLFGEATDIKAKIFEGGACKTFVLTEYCEAYLDLFNEKKEMIMFEHKKELLDKVKFYLKNEKEREKIAEAAYKKIIKVYSLDMELNRIFKEVYKKNKNLEHKKLPKITKKIISLSKKDLKLNPKKLRNKLKNYNYVFFMEKGCKNLKYRKYLQIYSLEKSGKPISCCDYYIHSKGLGDYLRFYSKRLFNARRDKFNFFLNINQFMVTKDYFLKNIEMFKGIFDGRQIKFVNEKNTVFVSIPLIRINNLVVKDYEIMKKAFDFNFLYQLHSLKYRKKIFSDLYIYALFLEVIKGKTFLLKSIIETLKDKSKKIRLKELKKKGVTSHKNL